MCEVVDFLLLPLTVSLLTRNMPILPSPAGDTGRGWSLDCSCPAVGYRDELPEIDRGQNLPLIICDLNIMTKVNGFTGFDMFGHKIARASYRLIFRGGQILEFTAVLIIGVGAVEQIEMIAGHGSTILEFVSRSSRLEANLANLYQRIAS